MSSYVEDYFIEKTFESESYEILTSVESFTIGRRGEMSFVDSFDCESTCICSEKESDFETNTFEDEGFEIGFDWTTINNVITSTSS